tara:strand:- start:17776 stop:18276 length:501 start_codon:yes stop_codon:yes gene_type:complete
MSYSDTSDAMYGLQGIGIETQKHEERKQEDFQNVALVTRNLWDMYSTEQQKRTKEMLGQMIEIPDPEDATKMIEVPAYKYDPQYLGGNFMKRQLTPGGGRVIPTEAGQTAIDSGGLKDIQGKEKLFDWKDKGDSIYSPGKLVKGAYNLGKKGLKEGVDLLSGLFGK